MNREIEFLNKYDYWRMKRIYSRIAAGGVMFWALLEWLFFG